jgi:hypothetical protein
MINKSTRSKWSIQAKSMKSLEKTVKGIALNKARPITLRSEGSLPSLPFMPNVRLKTLESRFEDMTREFDMVYRDLDQQTDRKMYNAEEDSIKSTCRDPGSELIDDVIKSVEKLVTLTSVSKKRILIPPHGCLPGRVDLCGKTLPAVLEFETKNPNIEILVAFNRCPTRQSYELRFTSGVAKIPEKYISEITNNFSIRFLVISPELINCEAFVRLSNRKSKLFLPHEHERSQWEPSVYDQVIDLNLVGSSICSSRSYTKKNQSVIERNVNSVVDYSKQNIERKFKNSVIEVEKKIQIAKVRKDLALEIKKAQLLKSLHKHESVQARSQRQLVATVDFLLQHSGSLVWIKLFMFYRVFHGMIQKIGKHKERQLFEIEVSKKTALIQKKIKPILGWLIKDKCKATLERVRCSIGLHHCLMRGLCS